MNLQRLFQSATILLGSTHAFLCQALPMDGSSTFSIGYRSDRLTANSIEIDSLEFRQSANKLKAHDIQISEIGLSSYTSIFYQWILEGFVNLGAVNSGKYRETDRTVEVFVSRADITSGWSTDASIGLGYNQPMGCGMSLQPMVGWSYDYLNIEMQHATTNGAPNSELNELTYVNYWQGPWVGLYSHTYLYNVDVKSGYEYHRPNWSATWTIAVPDPLGDSFSDRRRSNRASGQVFFVESSYTMPNCWDLGVCLKGGYWRATHGILKPRAGEEPILRIYQGSDVLKDATWFTFQAKVFCGTQF